MNPSPRSTIPTSLSQSEKAPSSSTNSIQAVGRNDAAFYRKMMPGWRCHLRELLVESLEGEIRDLVEIQVNSTYSSLLFFSLFLSEDADED